MTVTVAVTGATGAQGGAVVTSLLKSGADVHIRGISRSTTSDKAKALVSKGVEVVAGDFDHPDTLNAAFKGADSVFVVTNYWEHMDGPRELQQAKAAFDAAKAAGVKHIVWSTLEGTVAPLEAAGQKLELPDGKYPVPHLDFKHDASLYLASLGVPYTLLYTACYLENLLSFFPPAKVGENAFAVFSNTADADVFWCSVQDIGNVAAAVLLKGPEVGTEAGVCNAVLSFSELVRLAAEATGKNISYKAMSDEDYYQALLKFSTPPLAARDVVNMFVYFRECYSNIKKYRTVEKSKELYPSLESPDAAIQRIKDSLIKHLESQ